MLRAPGRLRPCRRSLPSAAWWALVVILAALAPGPARAADPWLFVNDLHFDRASRSDRPSHRGKDTNLPLLESTLREMQRLAPNPPVIVMAGDFLPHHFKRSDAESILVDLTHRLDRAFPRAQFVLALGNEDSPCGDYAMAPNSHFLQTVAKAWEPLVNRNGAAPQFARTFVHDGFYTARLPLTDVRAVVVDDVFWSPVYHNGCGGGGNPTPQAFGELDHALAPGGGERRWLVMHIPPGIDAFSTNKLVHHLAIVPFLRPDPRDALMGYIGDPARRVQVVVTGHVHRFAFRLIPRKGDAPVPLLISPAISPIYGNSPSFLTADVAPDGTIRNLEEHSYVAGRWVDVGGLGSLGASAFTGAALEAVQRRIEGDPALRATYARLYDGEAQFPEINADNWRSYWCVATEYTSTAYRDCLNVGGFSFLTRRGLAFAGVAVGVLAVLFALLALVAIVVLRRRRPPLRR